MHRMPAPRCCPAPTLPAMHAPGQAGGASNEKQWEAQGAGLKLAVTRMCVAAPRSPTSPVKDGEKA